MDKRLVTAIYTDDMCRYHHQADRFREYFMKMVETVKQPLVVLDEELPVRTHQFRLDDGAQDGAKQVLADARSFEFDDAKRWTVVTMEIVDAEEAR